MAESGQWQTKHTTLKNSINAVVVLEGAPCVTGYLHSKPPEVHQVPLTTESPMKLKQNGRSRRARVVTAWLRLMCAAWELHNVGSE
jgi:hypothetical protein